MTRTAAAAASQCSKSWPQISEPGGRVVGQDTRGSTRRGWVGVGAWGGGGTDGSKCEGGGGPIDRGGIVFEELAARNMLPSYRYRVEKKKGGGQAEVAVYAGMLGGGAWGCREVGCGLKRQL